MVSAGAPIPTLNWHGFRCMANAGGRLAGTVLSGWAYQTHGLVGCLWWSVTFVFLALLLSLRLPDPSAVRY